MSDPIERIRYSNSECSGQLGPHIPGYIPGHCCRYVQIFLYQIRERYKTFGGIV